MFVMNTVSSILLVILLSYKSVHAVYVTYVEIGVIEIEQYTDKDQEDVMLEIVCYSSNNREFWKTEPKKIEANDYEEIDESHDFRNDLFNKCSFQLFDYDRFSSNDEITGAEIVLKIDNGADCDKAYRDTHTFKGDEIEWQVVYWYKKHGGNCDL
mmetsp:Transcript_21729/g.19162  ORF Transcript_21729/g.19162 Transcript_21729/m.19162 type:complete len:155 (-) Transcript_21729:181-645(-)